MGVIVGERIKSRLGEKGLSQSELARRVRLDQSTISGLIKGEQRSSTHLHKIARELSTTAAYLEGETDDPDEHAPAAPELDSEERELVDNFSDLSPADRRALLQISRSMAGNASAGGTVHAPASEFRGEPSPAAPDTRKKRK